MKKPSIKSPSWSIHRSCWTHQGARRLMVPGGMKLLPFPTSLLLYVCLLFHCSWVVSFNNKSECSRIQLFFSESPRLLYQIIQLKSGALWNPSCYNCWLRNTGGLNSGLHLKWTSFMTKPHATPLHEVCEWNWNWKIPQVSKVFRIVYSKKRIFFQFREKWSKAYKKNFVLFTTVWIYNYLTKISIKIHAIEKSQYENGKEKSMPEFKMNIDHKCISFHIFFLYLYICL